MSEKEPLPPHLRYAYDDLGNEFKIGATQTPAEFNLYATQEEAKKAMAEKAKVKAEADAKVKAEADAKAKAAATGTKP